MSTVSTELKAEEFAALKMTARAKESPYIEDVKALRPGFARQIIVPDGVLGRVVVNNVHKAAKQLGVKVQVLNREKAVPPRVIFQLVTPPAVAAQVDSEKTA